MSNKPSVHLQLVSSNSHCYSTHFLCDRFEDIIKANLFRKIGVSFEGKITAVLQAEEQKQYAANQWALVCQLAALEKMMEDFLNGAILTRQLPQVTHQRTNYHQSMMRKRREVVTGLDRLISSTRVSGQDSNTLHSSH
jgi:hypothetical protein